MGRIDRVPDGKATTADKLYKGVWEVDRKRVKRELKRVRGIGERRV